MLVSYLTSHFVAREADGGGRNLNCVRVSKYSQKTEESC